MLGVQNDQGVHNIFKIEATNKYWVTTNQEPKRTGEIRRDSTETDENQREPRSKTKNQDLKPITETENREPRLETNR